MRIRDDDTGLFWNEIYEKAARGRNSGTRIMPPIPDTGWSAPKEFPRLADAKLLSLDVETKDIDLRSKGPGFRRGAHMVGIAVGTTDGRRWYFPMRHEVAPEQNMDPEHVLAWARDNLCSPNQTKVGANLSYDVDALWSEGVPVTGPFLDVQFAEALLDEYRFTYSLESLAQKYLGEGKVKHELEDWAERAYGTGEDARAEIWRCPPCLVGPYAIGDVDLPLRILDLQLDALRREKLEDLFELECSLIPMIVAMRQRGVRVDLKRAQELDDRLSASIETIQQQLQSIAGHPVNINATSDLSRLFDKAGVAYPRTAKGAPSFQKEWLLHSPSNVAQLVTQQRTLTKYRDTFIRSYVFDLHVNGRLHCLFHPLRTDQNGTVSGRFSSSMPNLQNIPSRDDVWGPLLRSIFIPEDGCMWVRHDWSQIEYRFLAHFGQGQNAEVVRDEYRNNPDTDFHAMVMRMTGLARKPAKTVNFGLVYGMGPSTLAAQLGMTVEEATTKIFNPYHERVPFVKQTYDTAADRARSYGYVRTVLGRRARFTLYQDRRKRDSPAFPLEEAAAHYGSGNLIRAYTHKALNRILQGSSADLMKLAMRDIWRSSGVQSVCGPAHVTVHDELGHSVPVTKEGSEAAAEIKRIMETCLKISIPIRVDEERGPSWGDCK